MSHLAHHLIDPPGPSAGGGGGGARSPAAELDAVLAAIPPTVFWSSEAALAWCDTMGMRASQAEAHAALIELLGQDDPAVLDALKLGRWHDESGQTPLHICCTFGSEVCAQRILAAGAAGELEVDINAGDATNLTPLHLACDAGFDTLVGLLLRFGADLAAASADVTGRLGGIGADLSISGGRTPLHFAAAGGRVEVAQLLLEAGADPTATDVDGCTPRDACLFEAATRARVTKKLSPRFEQLAATLAAAAPGVDPATPPLADLLTAADHYRTRRRGRLAALATEAKRRADNPPTPVQQGLTVHGERQWLYALDSPAALAPHVDPGLRAALAALTKDPTDLQQLEDVLDCPVPGVVALPLFSEALRTALCDEVERIEAWADAQGVKLARPNSMNRYGLRLKEAGLQHVVEAAIDMLTPLVLLLFPAELPGGATDLADRHAFTIRYRGGEDRSLDTHVDSSLVTLNVCLGRAFSGGGVYFHKRRPKPAVPPTTTELPAPPAAEPPPEPVGGVLAAARDTSPDESDADVDPMESHGPVACPRCVFVHGHAPGVALLHLGRHIHGALPIESGERTNVVVWCRPRPHA